MPIQTFGTDITQKVTKSHLYDALTLHEGGCVYLVWLSLFLAAEAGEI